MVYSAGLKSPREEPSPPNFTSPVRTASSGQFTSNPSPTSSAERAGLHRRFTTNTVPTLPTLSSLSLLSPIGQQRRQAAEQPADIASSALQKAQLLMKKKEEYEILKMSRDRVASEMEASKQEMQLLELSSQERQLLENEVKRLSFPGPQSEPTTPPEYRESMTTAPIRPNRFSLAGLTSPQKPPAVNSTLHRNTRSGSHHGLGLYPTSDSHTPGQSGSSSHRNSDEEEDEEEDSYEAELPLPRRRPAVRNSMPVTNFDYRGMSTLPDVASVLGISNINSINSLLDDDDFPMPSHRHSMSIDGNSVLRSNLANDLSYPRSGDLATMPGQTTPQKPSWPTYQRHRQGQQSLPMNTLRGEAHDVGPSHNRNSSTFDGPAHANNRRSMDISLPSLASSVQPTLAIAPQQSVSMPGLRSSFSANDIPTVTSHGNAANVGLTHAEQHLHNHNAMIGRIPIGVTHRREMSGDRRLSIGRLTESISAMNMVDAPATGRRPELVHAQSAGPAMPQIQPMVNAYQPVAAPAQPILGAPQAYPYIGGYSPAPNVGPGQWSQPAYYGYQNFVPQYSGRARDNQQLVMQSRRAQNDESVRDHNRFANADLDTMRGQIFSVSKDQHGCRFLQKKIDEDREKNVPIILAEVQDHIVQLMQDSFGNYLCQKLLEHCTHEQRTVLVNKAAPFMIQVAKNQHGTRALQKMIEAVQGPEQTKAIIEALSGDVVGLIQDLNGNHVIQKCLNHLSPADSDFIFQAVGLNALAVGSHRHGCCVLQRCIDHAHGAQQKRLVNQIIAQAFNLMQDQFGNYVVQYILDHGMDEYTGPLCNTFLGSVVELSKQKFSSNVVEKSIRVADEFWKRRLVEELYVPKEEMERLLRDGYANYVVQTALENAPPDMQTGLWDIVKQVLPNIRLLPSGRRLAQKLNVREGSLHSSGSVTPAEITLASPAANPTPRQAFGAAFGSDGRTSIGEPPQAPQDNALSGPWSDPGHMARRNMNPMDGSRGGHRQYNYARYGPGPQQTDDLRSLSFF